MNRSFILLLVLATIIFYGCKKSETLPANAAGYKITLIKGDGQTNTIGHSLKDSIVFKVTKDGQAISKGYVSFKTFQSDNVGQYLEKSVGSNNPASMADPLVISFKWKLNKTIGKQSLKAVLYDSLREPQDSLTVTAIGVVQVPGWYASNSIPVSTFSNSFCNLPSGRVLAALRNVDYPYYSDDEGETWQDRSKGLPTGQYWGDIQYTKSGKLFSLTGAGIFLSDDKGLNWHQVTFGLGYYAGFWEAASMTDGTLFALFDRTLVTSTDGGETWKPVYSLSSQFGVTSLCIDDDDKIVVGVVSGAGVPYGFYLSNDKGNSWTLTHTINPNSSYDQTISQISNVSRTFYFYASDRNILTRTNDFINYTALIPPVTNNGGRVSFRYIVTTTGHVIISTEFYGIYYYVP